MKAFRTGHYFLALFLRRKQAGILIVIIYGENKLRPDRNFASLSYETKE